MRLLYEEWQSSGLSKKLFALAQGVSPSTFYYWVKKFENLAASSTKPAQGFEQIGLGGAEDPAVIATVRYPSGAVLEWHGSADTVQLLKALL